MAAIVIVGVFVNRLIVSGFAILAYSIDVLAVSLIERVFELGGFPISKGLVDFYYLLGHHRLGR